MNLATLIAKRAEEGQPIRVGMIGAGKFGTMFLAQAERQRGIHIIGICDLNPEATRSNLALANWRSERPPNLLMRLQRTARLMWGTIGKRWSTILRLRSSLNVQAIRWLL